MSEFLRQNTMKNLRFLLLLLTCVSSSAFAQIGSWRDHFPYSEGLAVADGGDYVYCATELGIIQYGKNDNSVERLSKANALSDIGISTIAFNNYNSTLLVGYTNGNVDLIKDNLTTNLSDIERNANIIGDKTIYGIYFRNNLAYLSCGFGIVVLDMDREEVKESYFIGPNASQIRVNAVTRDATHIYAATEENGLLRASLSSSNLGDFNNWSQMMDVPTVGGPFNAMVTYNNRVFVNYHDAVNLDSDTIYYYDGSTWSNYAVLHGKTNHSLNVSTGRLVVAHNYNVTSLLPNEVIETQVYDNINSLAGVSDGTAIWIADTKRGLVKSPGGASHETIKPDGPGFSSVGDMEFGDENLWVAPARLTGPWNNPNNIEGVASLREDEWNHYKWNETAGVDSARSFVDAAVDPSDNSHVFMGSWTHGLYEFRDGVKVASYGENNSTIQTNVEVQSSLYWVTVGGCDFDDDGNLWVSNSSCQEPVSVLTASGTWVSFGFDGTISNKRIRDMVVDNGNNKWIINKDNGIFVFNERGTLSDDTDDDFRLLTTAAGSGNLPSATVNCMTQDLDGEMWVGTNEGVAVFYSPDNIFSSSGVDAQQILLEQDGNIQILLETEIVTAIAVDGANRKWIGTSGAGVFLMSADGTEQIEAFNTDNSPLVSNIVNDIAINHRTGEVLFGTDAGIVSYMGSATGFSNNYGDVYAYPNPVRESYSGPIAIKGLLRNTDVKVTDISGNLVFETTSEGGQAIWDGNTMFGERAKTGVYLVFCSDSDGEKTIVTKILLVN